MMLLFPGNRSSQPETPVLHNMSVPPRTRVEIAMQPVFGLRVIDLKRCLRKNRSRPRVFSSRLPVESDRTSMLWEQLEARFELTRESINERIATWKGFLAGRTRIRARSDEFVNQSLSRIPVCPDLELTIGILSRLAGNLFLPRREPDYSFEGLSRRNLVVDDPRIPLEIPATPENPPDLP